MRSLIHSKKSAASLRKQKNNQPTNKCINWTQQQLYERAYQRPLTSFSNKESLRHHVPYTIHSKPLFAFSLCPIIKSDNVENWVKNGGLLTLNIDMGEQVKDGGLDQVDLLRLQLLPLPQLLSPQGEPLCWWVDKHDSL